MLILTVTEMIDALGQLDLALANARASLRKISSRACDARKRGG